MWGSWFYFGGVVLIIALPHVAVGVDVAGGRLRVQLPVVAAEGFEEGEALRNARVIQQLVQRALDPEDIQATAAQDVLYGGCQRLVGLLVERLQRSNGCRKRIQQLPVRCRARRGSLGYKSSTLYSL